MSFKNPASVGTLLEMALGYSKKRVMRRIA